MQPPAYLLNKNINSLPTLGDGRQSGTSGSPSILNASPEAADGGGLAYLKSGDSVRIDLNTRSVMALVDSAEWAERKETMTFDMVESQTWWQEIYRENVSNMDTGAIFHGMTKYKDIIAKTPRHSH